MASEQRHLKRPANGQLGGPESLSGHPLSPQSLSDQCQELPLVPGVSGAEPPQSRAAAVSGHSDGGAEGEASSVHRIGISRQVAQSFSFSGLSPAGQVVMPWETAQLGLDGVAYALAEPKPEPEPEIERPDPRQLWLDEVAEAAQPWLQGIAGRHRNQAAKAYADPEVPFSTVLWHSQRAEGASKRFEKVEECGQKKMARQCGDCHEPMRLVPLGCSSWSFCLGCRAKRAEKYRHRFRDARHAALDSYQMAVAHGGWSEKFATFTLPHSGDTVADLRVLPKARSKFFRSLREHLVIDRGMRPEMAKHPYCAVEECTEGDDMQGHAHMHVWMLSPFVHYVALRILWWRALPQSYRERCPTRPIKDVVRELKASMTPARWKRTRKQIAPLLYSRRGDNGRLMRDVPWPVLDIQKARGDVDQELVKYLIKDAVRDKETGELVYMEPGLYARICEGFAGLRAVVVARGFWVESGYCEHCTDCGSVYVLHRIIDDAKPEETHRAVMTRGPPGQDQGGAG